MNLNLRKANAIQLSISEALSSINISESVSITEFEDPVKVIQQANDELFANDARKQKLLNVLYNIRALVATANASSGISTALAKCAYIDKRIASLSSIANGRAMTDLEVIKGKLEKIKASDKEYYRDDYVSTSVLGQDQIDQAKAEVKRLKKTKQSLNDEILELNVKTEIPLTDDTVAVLTEEGIL